jgi:hypothetical protein
MATIIGIGGKGKVHLEQSFRWNKLFVLNSTSVSVVSAWTMVSWSEFRLEIGSLDAANRRVSVEF